MGSNFTQIQIKSAMACTSPRELAELASKNGIEMSVEQAERAFNSLNKNAALSDDEIANVAGGGWDFWKPTCPVCKSLVDQSFWDMIIEEPYVCGKCGYNSIWD